MANPRAALLLDRIGRRVGELRRQRDWTQERLAEKMGVSSSYLRRIERGKENLTVRSLIRIANTLGASLAELVIELPKTGKRKKGRPRRT